ncbi:DUF2948 family protein [Polymorphum gilvum]|uniref:Hypothetical cytosolic protein n=1 Tax=Polymorphum gilvum (strain LMG 25793 / CGMCC 1.9160 / SL003B-26A1) TaxID=991905 RepID=F2IWV0_POLGS|nr:DUF2948 family protein [Polymorphum gilvum]ADZ71527.1 Hypothetical cytosolic protein [Polymorphum gilvum SL003B-26A1]
MDQLKLAALDEEDLAVISAHVQDAVLTVGDIRYLPREKKAIVAMNRFVWDKAADRRAGTHERRRAAMAFSRVICMRANHVRQEAKDAVLELLAVRFVPGEAPAGTVRLDFAGGGVIALDVECIEVQLADLGAAWATPRKPHHDLD